MILVQKNPAAFSIKAAACLSYLVVAGPHKGIVTQVAADVGRDDFAVDAIAGNKILIHTSTGTRSSGAGIAWLRS